MIPELVLLKPPKGFVRPFHPWIYQSQIAWDCPVNSGELVDIFTDRGRFVGRGYANPSSQLAIRLLSRQAEAIDGNFLRRKIERACAFRRSFVRDTNAYRLISSEADGMPGFIADLYSEVLVVQFLTAGMERLRPLVLEALTQAVPCRGIYERSDSSSRRMEGLQPKTGWIRKDCADEVVVRERDIEYVIQFGEGHKTGFYLDQRENRFLLRELGIRGRVLDAFCYEGAFGLHLAKGGATVTGIDIQAENLARAQLHRQRNGIPRDRLEFRAANVFDELKELENKNEKFDLLILDPPSFVKKKAALDGALAGFKEIILRGMRLLNEGGLLAVFSCSYHVDETLLMQTAMSAAMDTRKALRLVRSLRQSSDHPINPFIPETYYLKGFLFEVSSV